MDSISLTQALHSNHVAAKRPRPTEADVRLTQPLPAHFSSNTTGSGDAAKDTSYLHHTSEHVIANLTPDILHTIVAMAGQCIARSLTIPPVAVTEATSPSPPPSPCSPAATSTYYTASHLPTPDLSSFIGHESHLLFGCNPTHLNILRKLRAHVDAGARLGNRSSHALWGSAQSGKRRIIAGLGALLRDTDSMLVLEMDGNVLRGDDEAIRRIVEETRRFLHSSAARRLQRRHEGLRRLGHSPTLHDLLALGESFEDGTLGSDVPDLSRASVTTDGSVTTDRSGNTDTYATTTTITFDDDGIDALLLQGGGAEDGVDWDTTNKLRSRLGGGGITFADDSDQEADDNQGATKAARFNTGPASSTIGGALSKLQACLLYFNQIGITMAVFIHNVKAFGVRCDRVMYILSGLLHEAPMDMDFSGQPSDGPSDLLLKGGGVSFIVTSRAPDVSLEKRLSSRLTSELWYCPLIVLPAPLLLSNLFGIVGHGAAVDAVLTSGRANMKGLNKSHEGLMWAQTSVIARLHAELQVLEAECVKLFETAQETQMKVEAAEQRKRQTEQLLREYDEATEALALKKKAFEENGRKGKKKPPKLPQSVPLPQLPQVKLTVVRHTFDELYGQGAFEGLAADDQIIPLPLILKMNRLRRALATAELVGAVLWIGRFKDNKSLTKASARSQQIIYVSGVDEIVSSHSGYEEAASPTLATIRQGVMNTLSLAARAFGSPQPNFAAMGVAASGTANPRPFPLSPAAAIATQSVPINWGRAELNVCRMLIGPLWVQLTATSDAARFVGGPSTASRWALVEGLTKGLMVCLAPLQDLATPQMLLPLQIIQPTYDVRLSVDSAEERYRLEVRHSIALQRRVDFEKASQRLLASKEQALFGQLGDTISNYATMTAAVDGKPLPVIESKVNPNAYNNATCFSLPIGGTSELTDLLENGNLVRLGYASTEHIILLAFIFARSEAAVKRNLRDLQEDVSNSMRDGIRGAGLAAHTSGGPVSVGGISPTTHRPPTSNKTAVRTAKDSALATAFIDLKEWSLVGEDKHGDIFIIGPPVRLQGFLRWVLADGDRAGRLGMDALTRQSLIHMVR